ncbi:LANO_0H25312g1_1 [Lachancea nothofagi CBS 11611]|uniref:L-lactate dehydrogenase (cytochrome) n=1 Tax=Lachancea nothofagi CBS 11611 TaxID=1266666 RepID=A0A1G4KNW7_9SACH|nr:LANO_0H25312g1_1 [Lachancea nothofagi CBS 11611]
MFRIRLQRGCLLRTNQTIVRRQLRPFTTNIRTVNAQRVVGRLGFVAGIAIFSAGLYTFEKRKFASVIKNDVRQDSKKPGILPSEVARHDKDNDCWVVINGFVYDLTEFIGAHPGGPAIIQANAGKDVSAIFSAFHAPDVIEKYLPEEKCLGPLDGHMQPNLVSPALAPGETPEDIERKEELRQALPELDSLINLYDFEYLASQILTKQAWTYYSSGSEDEFAHRENHAAYHRIFFKPRVLVNVGEIDTSTVMLGHDVSVPFYVSATALVKLGNPEEGEKDIARGCGQGEFKCPQMISNFASCTLKETVEAAPSKDQLQWLQVYVNTNKSITENLLKEAEKLGLKAIFITVDAPCLGRREKDIKLKFTSDNNPQSIKKTKLESSIGASRALSSFQDAALTWDDVVELKSKTNLPIVIKGVQCVEDVLKAVEIGASGVVLSNHGGRQLDFSRAPIEVLAETMPILKERHLDDKLEIFIDGGVRRGTDILKALCLGAKGVGLGRPFLYANSCYGRDGVEKAIDMLTEEIQYSMRLLGVKSINELRPELLDLSGIKNRSVDFPQDSLYKSVYEKPEHAQFVERD